MASIFKMYPVPAAATRQLIDSFDRVYIPGTNPARRYARGKHGGIDISCAYGANVYPVRNGVVVATGDVWGPAYGKQVLVKHRFLHNGVYLTRYSFYPHLADIDVRVGQTVYATKTSRHGRTRLGDAGSTGQSTGNHVHFEWSKDRYWHIESKINPYKHLEAARKAWLASH